MSATDGLEAAILTTVAYCDVFAFAPGPAELHRFLIGAKASRAAVERALRESSDLRRQVGVRDGLYFLAGKEHLAPRRTRFRHHAEWMWPKARRAASWLERSGLALCGLVTGSLAADNADEHADIDFLLIYPAHRTYLSFATVRAVQKVPGLGLSNLCPNYALAADRLEVRPQNLFTAYEIAKSVPMFGHSTYARFAAANAWVRRYLPNALPILDGAPAPEPEGSFPYEKLFRLPPIAALERLEEKRKRKTDTRDVGVDMNARERLGSMDRHSPTRSFQTLAELRYRMDRLGLHGHPLYQEIQQNTRLLAEEMVHWGDARLEAQRPALNVAPTGTE